MSVRLEFMDKKERMTTKAFWVWSKSGADPSQRFMLLMNHAKQSLDESETVPRTMFVPRSFDLIDEANQNKELHASMDFMRLMLKAHRKPAAVEPLVRTIPFGGGKMISPAEHAKELKDPYPELGKWLTKRLRQHQTALHKTGYPFQYLGPKQQPRPL